MVSARRKAAVSSEEAARSANLPNGTLECHGAQEDLSAIGHLRDHAFPPVVISEAWWREVTPRGTLLTVGCICASAIADLGPFPGLCAGIIFEMGSRMVLQKHYRVAPGRINVLRNKVTTSELVVVYDISLRGATVIARLDEGLIAIKPIPSEGSFLTINLERVSDPTLLTRAVFEAAICESVAPQLPTNAFVG